MLPCKLAMIKQKNYAFKLGKPNGFICNPCGSLAKYPVIPIRSEESVQLRDVETQCFASMNTTMLCFSKYTPSINRGQIPLQLSEPLIYVIK